MKKRGGVLALVLILGAAAALRSVGLDDLGYNSDEAVYAGQAAALARVPVLSDLFPVFRAHPLLFQLALATLHALFGPSDLLGRALAAAVGIATVFLVARLGQHLYGRRAGLFAALFLALMPYHVVVCRQVLLDGPMVFFSTLSLLLVARFAETGRPAFLHAAGCAMGLTFLAKETGILLAGAIYAFLALSPEIRLRVRDLLTSLLLMVVVMAAFPLSVSLAGGGGERKAQQYLVWQLFRRPNHDWDFYLRAVPPAIGLLVITAGLAGLVLLRHRQGWREKLLLLWVIVPTVFFFVWPTKGFQYLLPAAPPLALLAARTVAQWPSKDFRVRGLLVPRSAASFALAVLIALSLAHESWGRLRPDPSGRLLAGAGGVPGGRETGHWVAAQVPEGATMVTIGPSMANILKFYGHRNALGLSVSPNPLHRNPSYEPVGNLDYLIRTGQVQYLVWDAFSASRSSFFSEKLRWYVEKYQGRVVYSHSLTVTSAEGVDAEKPLIVVYGVRP